MVGGGTDKAIKSLQLTHILPNLLKARANRAPDLAYSLGWKGRNNMQRVIDAIVIFVWVSIFIICGKDLIYVLGGSVTLSLPLTAVYLFSYLRGEHSKELSSAAIILLSLMLINYVGYLEKLHKIPFVGIVGLFCFLSIIIIGAFAYLVIKPFNGEMIRTKERANAHMRRLLFENCSLYPALGLVVFCIPTAFPLSSDFKSRAFPGTWSSYIPIAAFWLALSFAVTSVALRKAAKGVSKLVKTGTVRKYPNRNKAIVAIFGIVLCFGSVTETVRGAWILWTDTILLAILISTAVWSIWKHVFSEEEPHDISPAQEIVAPSSDLKKLFTIIFVYVVLGAAYLICLTIRTIE